ncbi:MAG: hypothetical protein FWG44_06425 [Oscillospiraceae bacterium]|nr:hypothetical protein [Oscillospiraceae bacterium]
MVIHSIISEHDIFYMPEETIQKAVRQEKDNLPKNNVIPCMTDPKTYFKTYKNFYSFEK